MELVMNTHARKRAAQRNISVDEIAYIKAFGHRYHRAGAIFYYLRHKDIPKYDRKNDELMRLAGTALVLTKDGREVLTVWHNPQTGLKYIRKKPTFSTPQY